MQEYSSCSGELHSLPAFPQMRPKTGTSDEQKRKILSLSELSAYSAQSSGYTKLTAQLLYIKSIYKQPDQTCVVNQYQMTHVNTAGTV